jgi:hypothetical protein
VGRRAVLRLRRLVRRRQAPVVRIGSGRLRASVHNGRERRRSTPAHPGKWEVTAAQLSADGRSFEIHTSEASPFEQHFYRIASHRWRAGAAHVSSRWPQCDRVARGTVTGGCLSTSKQTAGAVRDAEPARRIADAAHHLSVREWLAFNWMCRRSVMVPASDGVQVPARIYRPKGRRRTA